MTEEPENHTIRLLQEMRAELKDRDEKISLDIARVHADVALVHADVARLSAKVNQMHSDIASTKVLVLELVIKVTALEKRIIAVEPA